MFIAGSEIKLTAQQTFDRSIFLFVLFNGGIPFSTGFLIGLIFNLPTIGALIVGITFISTSIAVVIPSIESLKIMNSRVGRLVVPATIIEDIVAITLLSVVLRNATSESSIPWPLYFLFVGIIIIGLKYIIPRLEKIFKPEDNEDVLFESELRFTIAIITASAIIFELIGLGPIIAGFVTGFLAKEYMKNTKIEDKIKTISYGIFIPVFFIIIGTTLDITSIRNPDSLLLIILVPLGLILSKFLSALVIGHYLKLEKHEKLVVGSLTIAQLTTTLATVFAATEAGLITSEFRDAFIILSIVSTMLSPILTNMFHRKTYPIALKD